MRHTKVIGTKVKLGEVKYPKAEGRRSKGVRDMDTPLETKAQ
jgi:hypothetical protein